MEFDDRLLSEAKSNGQFDMVQNILVTIGKMVTEGRKVVIKSHLPNKSDINLMTFEDLQSWLQTEHSDILAM